MEQNGISGCRSGDDMEMQMNITTSAPPAAGVLQAADGQCFTTHAAAKEATGGSSAAAAAARRRRSEINKEKGFVKRKRTAHYRTNGFVPPPLPPNVVDPGRLMFLFFKKLQASDVTHIGRTIMPKIPVETHLPRLLDNQSIILHMLDMDGVDAWSFKFRYWANNQSRMYVLEGTGEFTKKHRLKRGDYMLMYLDFMNQEYVIRAVKASEIEGCANTALIENKADDMLPNYVDFDAYTTDFFNMDDLMGTTFLDDDYYFSDILNSFSSWDDFMSGYPTTQPRISFDNLSDEDLSQLKV